MAEIATGNTQAIVKASDQYSITVKDVDNAGKTVELSVPIAQDSNFDKWNLMLRAVVLKKTTWAKYSMPEIIHAIVYADKMGLDIVAGDVYTGDGGRLSTTAGAKIRHAMNSGRIEGYEVDITEGPEISLSYTLRGAQETWTGKELFARVTVDVKGFTRPVVYTTKLSEWFVGTNPNWRQRPGYMLRRNALSKALEEVAPLGTEADEAPPLESPVLGIAAGVSAGVK